MPFMEDDSTDSDSSSHCSGSSPRSTTTDATTVSTYQEYDGSQKRKREREILEPLPRKRSRMEPCFDGKAVRADPIPGTSTSRRLQKDEEVDSFGQLANLDAEKCGSLPTSIWKSVFAYLPPRSLGALLSVNTVFHRVLTGSPKPGVGPITREGIHKDSERIWTLARQRYHSHFPRPLHGYRELDMWKLVGSVECQFCARSFESPLQSSVYQVGNRLSFQEPLHTDIYWPLAVRSCHQCLGQHFLTESELELLGRSYLVPSMNHAMVKSVPAPRYRIFLRSHTEWLHAEIQKIAHDSGSAVVECWLKTYEMNARKRQRDATRWERWEATNERAKLFPVVGASPGRHSGASSPALSHRSSPTHRFHSPMSERRPSPARSDSSIMGKNRNRGPKNKGQNDASATGANAVPTGGHTAPMSRAVFNRQTQPALPWNTAHILPAFGSPSAIAAPRIPASNSAPATPISSFCRPAAPLVVPPFSNSTPSDGNTSTLLDAIKAITRPSVSTAQVPAFTRSSLTSGQSPAASTPLAQPPRPTHRSPAPNATLVAPIAPTQPVQPVAARPERRQPSIHPEETIKVEPDGLDPSRPTKLLRGTISSFETEESLRPEGAYGVSRIRYLPESHYRPRSRSPPGDRVRSYRERNYSRDYRGSRQYDYPVQPPAVRYAPHVLYDDYGNEYVCTGRRPTPYVLYEPSPPRGY